MPFSSLSGWFALRLGLLIAALIAAVIGWYFVERLGGPTRVIPELVNLHLRREAAGAASRAARITRDIQRLNADDEHRSGARVAAARRLAQEGLARRKSCIASGLSVSYGAVGAQVRMATTDNTDLHAAAATLVRALDDRDPRLRLEAAYALSHLQLSPRQVGLAGSITHALEGTYDRAIQTYLTRTLGDFGPAAASAAPVISPLLDEDDPVLAASAARALARLGTAAWSQASEARLVGRLSDADPSVRERCAQALGAIGALSVTTRSALRPLLDDEDAWVKVAAALSLTDMGDTDAAILEQLAQAYELPPRTTIYVEDVAQVMELRKRITAVYTALGEAPDGLLPMLVKMARQAPDIEPREQAIARIAGRGTYDARRAQTLVQLLQAPDTWVYYAVVDALIAMGPEVMPLVEPLRAHEQREVRQFADKIIAKLQPVQRSRTVFDPASMTEYEATTDSYLRMELAVAMARTGDRRAIDYLLTRADDRVLNGPVLDVVTDRLIGDLRHHKFQPTDNLDARQAALESLVYLGVLSNEQAQDYIANIENPDLGDEIQSLWRARRARTPKAPGLREALDALYSDLPTPRHREVAAYAQQLLATDLRTRVDALRGLQRIAEEAVEAPAYLTLAIADPHAKVREAALSAFIDTRQSDPDALQALANTLHSTEQSDRVNALAAKALAQLGSAALPTLTEAAGEAAVAVRRAATFGLLELGEAARPALPLLQQLTQDSNLGVQTYARRALEALGEST